jgi:hypothetical protein
VVLLEALLSPVRQDVNIPSLSHLVTQLQTLAIHTSHSLTSRNAARFVASLVNKAHDGKFLILSDPTGNLSDCTTCQYAFNQLSSFTHILKYKYFRECFFCIV